MSEVLLSSGRYYASVFLPQQAAEKALKAVYIRVRRELPPRMRNLVELRVCWGLIERT